MRAMSTRMFEVKKLYLDATLQNEYRDIIVEGRGSRKHCSRRSHL